MVIFNGCPNSWQTFPKGKSGRRRRLNAAAPIGSTDGHAAGFGFIAFGPLYFHFKGPLQA